MMFKEDIQSLSGKEFERICGELMSAMGFQVEYTKASGDGGVDLVARNHSPLIKGRYIIQCKRYTGTVGEPIIRDLYGVVASQHAVKGILITTGNFSTPAQTFAHNLPIELINGYELKNLLSEYGIVSAASHIEVKSDSIKTILEAIWEDESYIKLKQNCLADGCSTSSVAKLANFLYRKAIDVISAYHCPMFTIQSRIALLEEAKKQLLLLDERLDNKTITKNDRVKLYVCKLMLAQVYFLSGQCNDAERCYHFLLEQNEIAYSLKRDNGLIDLFWEIAFDMCSFYSCIGKKDLASKWLTHPIISELFCVKRTVYLQNYDYGKLNEEYFNVLMKDFESVIDYPKFHPVIDLSYSVPDRDTLFDSSNIYDPILKQYDYRMLCGIIEEASDDYFFYVDYTTNEKPSLWNFSRGILHDKGEQNASQVRVLVL
ncbi:MAG: restriction endonuclease [Acutalibacteraceae bacterium]